MCNAVPYATAGTAGPAQPARTAVEQGRCPASWRSHRGIPRMRKAPATAVTEALLVPGDLVELPLQLSLILARH